MSKALSALNAPRPETSGKRDNVRWRVRTYTDNYLLHTRLRKHGESDLGRAFEALGSFQCVLVRHHHLCRGGIAVGPAYIDDTIVFGRPVVEAHYLEQEIAKYPRILLSNGIARIVARNFAPYGGRPYTSTDYHILEDADGQWFVNYLAHGLTLNEDEFGWMIDENLFSAHCALIASGMRRYLTDDRVYTKYLWAAIYHNWFVRTHRLHEWHNDLLIDVPSAYDMKPPSPVSNERIAMLMDSYRRRLRGTDQDFDDVVRIAARL